MQYLLGFMIALCIALTGVGAGTITVPMLVLFLGVPASAAVSIGLMFTAAVKSILVPAQIARGQVAWRTLGYMVLGGIPGVLLGSLLLRHLVNAGAENLMKALLGLILMATASWQITDSIRRVARTPRESQGTRKKADRSPWLTCILFPVGAEVGLSSAGAGALGSAALLSLTPLDPAQVVGTDLVFGFLLSLIGSGAHGFSPGANRGLLLNLIVGGIAGAICGTLISGYISRRMLRLALWAWLLILGAQFLLNSYQAWATPFAHAKQRPSVRTEPQKSKQAAPRPAANCTQWPVQPSLLPLFRKSLSSGAWGSTHRPAHVSSPGLQRFLQAWNAAST